MVRLLHGHIPLIRDIPIPRQAGRQMTIILPSGYYELVSLIRYGLEPGQIGSDEQAGARLNLPG